MSAREKRRATRTVLLLFLLALTVRLVYLYETRNTPFAMTPVMDQGVYDNWARDILEHSKLGFKSEHFWQPPLYPYFMAAVYRIFGYSYPAVRLVQALLGALTCALVFLFSRQFFRYTPSLMAGIAATFYGPFIYATGELSPVTTIIFLDLLCLFLLFNNRKRWHPGITAAAGILMGLSIVGKPVILPAALCLAVWLLLQHRDRSLFSGLLHSALFVIPMFLVILPVTIRNYTVTGECFMVSTNGGINFYIGNNAHYEEVVASRPGFYRESYLEVVDDVFSNARGQTNISSQFYRRGVDYILSSPLDYLRLLGKKFYLFWHGKEILRDSSSYFFSRYSGILRILLWHGVLYFPFGLVAPFAIVGMVLGWRKDKDFRCCVVFLLIYMSTIMLFFSSARYRLPLVPILLICAALTLAEIVESVKLRRWRAGFILAGIFALTVLLNMPAAASHANADIIYAATPFYQLGEIYYRNRSWDESIDAYNKVLQMIPRDTPFEYLFRTNVNQILGDIYLEKNDPHTAIRYFRQDIRDNPGEKTTYIRLIRTLEKTGKIEAAMAILEKGETLFGKDDFDREKKRLSGKNSPRLNDAPG